MLIAMKIYDSLALNHDRQEVTKSPNSLFIYIYLFFSFMLCSIRDI